MNDQLSNKEVYAKTLTFSVRRLVFSIVLVVVLGVLAAGGFLLTDRMMDNGLIGLGVGTVVGLVFIGILAHFLMYTLKAGQIAMMTQAVTEGTLPDNVYQAGKQAVKDRFVTVAAYYAATGIIKAVFRELGRAITKVGQSVGGNTGGAVGSTVDSAIQTVVAYLCDCCLGWIFYRKEISAFKATCEGTVIFFKHGKTLARNLGRVFGMAIASFVVIGGVFTAIFYPIVSLFPDTMSMLSTEIVQMKSEDNAQVINFLSNPTNMTIAVAVVLAIILWSVLHSTFVKPFILVGVLRNYMASGVNDIPDESSFSMLDKHSKKFKKYRQENS